MATVSFDERVIVTDKKIVAAMKKDLNNPVVDVEKRKSTYSDEKAQENFAKWLAAQKKMK